MDKSISYVSIIDSLQKFNVVIYKVDLSLALGQNSKAPSENKILIFIDKNL